MTDLTETIEALERAAAHIRIVWVEHTKDAARLDALAKALADLVSDDWWIEGTTRGPARLSCAEIVRERLEKP